MLAVFFCLNDYILKAIGKIFVHTHSKLWHCLIFCYEEQKKKASVCSSNNQKINSMGNLSTDAASMLQIPHPRERKAIKMPFTRGQYL